MTTRNKPQSAIALAISELTDAMSSTAGKIETTSIACPFFPYPHGLLIGHPNDSASLGQFMAFVTAETAPRGVPVSAVCIIRVPIDTQQSRYFYSLSVGEFVYWAGGIRDTHKGAANLAKLGRYFALIDHKRGLGPQRNTQATRALHVWLNAWIAVDAAYDAERAKDRPAVLAQSAGLS